MAIQPLDFEVPIYELEKKLEEAKRESLSLLIKILKVKFEDLKIGLRR